MQLVVADLGRGAQRVQAVQQLDAVVRLDVVQAVAEHLEQRVQDAPRVARADARQQLT